MQIGLHSALSTSGKVGAVVEEVRRTADSGLTSYWAAMLTGQDTLTTLAIAGTEVADIELRDRSGTHPAAHSVRSRPTGGNDPTRDRSAVRGGCRNISRSVRARPLRGRVGRPVRAPASTLSSCDACRAGCSRRVPVPYVAGSAISCLAP